MVILARIFGAKVRTPPLQVTDPIRSSHVVVDASKVGLSHHLREG
jgi:hypothetical protein